MFKCTIVGFTLYAPEQWKLRERDELFYNYRIVAISEANGSTIRMKTQKDKRSWSPWRRQTKIQNTIMLICGTQKNAITFYCTTILTNKLACLFSILNKTLGSWHYSSLNIISNITSYGRFYSACAHMS